MVIITALIILCCVFLVLIVLIQNPKGGGLASGFSGSNQVLGARRTTDFLEKSTWTLAIALLVLSITATAMINKGNKTTGGGSSTRGMAKQYDNKGTVPPGMQQGVPAGATPVKKP